MYFVFFLYHCVLAKNPILKQDDLQVSSMSGRCPGKCTTDFLVCKLDFSKSRRGKVKRFFCTTTNLNILTCAVKVVVGCNNDVGGFHENLATFRDSKVSDFRKDATKKMKFLGVIKQGQVCIRVSRTPNGGRTPQNRASPTQIRVESTCSPIFSVERGGEGVEHDSQRTLSPRHPRTSSHSLSLPLPPSPSFSLSLLVPVTLYLEGVWGGGDPLRVWTMGTEWRAGGWVAGGESGVGFGVSWRGGGGGGATPFQRSLKRGRERMRERPPGERERQRQGLLIQ